MKQTSEIKALLTLIDDPDDFVYQNVSDKIFSFGKEIIPFLESYWEDTDNDFAQERIEMLIHRLHQNQLQEDLAAWKAEPEDLLKGALIVSRFHYPDLNTADLLKEVEKIRKNLWLEINNYMTALETANVFNSIIYNFYKFKGVGIDYNNPEHFLPGYGIPNKKGNTFCLGIIYQSLCSYLDVPVKAVSIPRQFLLGFFNSANYVVEESKGASGAIRFYIDAFSGQLYSNNDILKYYKKIDKEAQLTDFEPLSNSSIIILLLKELSKCYTTEENAYKRKDLSVLISMLEDLP